MNAVSHTFNEGTGVLTFSTPPYKLYSKGDVDHNNKHCNYLSSESLEVLETGKRKGKRSRFYVDLIDLPNLKWTNAELRMSPDYMENPLTAVFDNLQTIAVNGLISFNDGYRTAKSVIRVPNAKKIRISGIYNSRVNLYAPLADSIYCGETSNGIENLTIGPNLCELILFDGKLYYLSEITFSGTKTQYQDWYSNNGQNILSKTPKLTTIQCSDGAITL